MSTLSARPLTVNAIMLISRFYRSSIVGRRSAAPAAQLGDRDHTVVRGVVDRNHTLHVELQALNVLEQAYRIGTRRRWRRGCRGLRIVRIGLDQDLLLREIGDEHPVVVSEVPQMMQLDDVRPVG